MPPPNTTDATAIAITSLPYSNTQQVDEGGTTYTVWYSYTAVTDDDVIGVYPRGAAPYTAITTIWLGPAGSLTAHVPDGQVGGIDRPLQFPVVAGLTYFIRIAPNGGNPSPANLTISALRAPRGTADAGSFFVNDDTNGFPAAILSRTTGLPILFIPPETPMVAGEAGACLDRGSGRILLEDGWNLPTLHLYTSGFMYLSAIASATQWRVIASNRVDTFYVGKATSPRTVTTLDENGTFGPTTWTVTGSGNLGAMAPSPDESILYYTTFAANGPIRRWDLVNDVALSDLVAAPGADYLPLHLLTLDDGSVVHAWIDTSPQDVILRRYSSAGALLNTYSVASYGTLISSDPLRLQYEPTDGTSFWVWLKLASGRSSFVRFRASDGVALEEVLDIPQFTIGLYQPTGTPEELFGHSFSCPFLLLPAGIIQTNQIGVIGPLVWVEFPRRITG